MQHVRVGARSVARNGTIRVSFYSPDKTSDTLMATWVEQLYWMQWMDSPFTLALIMAEVGPLLTQTLARCRPSLASPGDADPGQVGGYEALTISPK